MLAITAWIAKQERLRITDRVNAGIARARLHGTRSGAGIGRPRAVFNRAAVFELRAAGQSWSQMATALGVGVGTVRRAYERGLPKPASRETEIRDAVKRVAGA